ncbi:hypothetical protein LXL04_034496 [Taraxacum kok-saghyz]
MMSAVINNRYLYLRNTVDVPITELTNSTQHQTEKQVKYDKAISNKKTDGKCDQRIWKLTLFQPDSCPTSFVQRFSH